MDGEVNVRWYAVYLCDLCVAGAGGECHAPGCALWIKSAPDIGLWSWQCRPLDESAVPDPKPLPHEASPDAEGEGAR